MTRIRSAGEILPRTGRGSIHRGVKERPIAYKLGIGFCDHNHERKECLGRICGMLNFAREVHASVCSPVWNFVPRRSGRKTEGLKLKSRKLKR